jgi:hypothetical protein
MLSVYEGMIAILAAKELITPSEPAADEGTKDASKRVRISM